MIYCIHCGQLVDEKEHKCPYCGQNLVKRDLEYEEIRSLNRALHDREHESRERVDNALVKIVLGSTLFIIGWLFFLLSFKMDPDDFQKKLSFKASEFYVSMVALIAGAILLIIGIYSVIKEKAVVQKEVNHTLKLTQGNEFRTYDINLQTVEEIVNYSMYKYNALDRTLTDCFKHAMGEKVKFQGKEFEVKLMKLPLNHETQFKCLVVMGHYQGEGEQATFVAVPKYFEKFIKMEKAGEDLSLIREQRVYTIFKSEHEMFNGSEAELQELVKKTFSYYNLFEL